MFAQLHRASRRFLMMLGGEMLQSAFHFAVNIALLHMLSPRDYGLFAIVMLVGGLGLTYMRSLAGMPANLMIPPSRGRRRAAVFAVTFGSGAMLLAGFGGLGVAAAMSRWIDPATALLAGTFVGLWALRSFVRTLLFAQQRPFDATMSDVAYMVSGLGFALLLVHGADGGLLMRVFAAFALANVAAIALALALPRLPVRWSFGRGTRRRYRVMARQLGWSCAGVTTANLQAQGQVALIAALSGPAAYAPVAAMVVFFAPLRLFATALANMMQPELAHRLARGDRGRVRHLLLVWTLAMSGIGLAYGGAMMLALPFLNAPVFDGQPKLLLALLAWGINAAMLLYVMPRILLEVLRAFRVIAVLTATSATVGLALVAVLLGTLGPAWSLIGGVASEVMVLVWCWAAVRRFVTRAPAAVLDLAAPSPGTA